MLQVVLALSDHFPLIGGNLLDCGGKEDRICTGSTVGI